MVKKCAICNNDIKEEYEKLKGTMLKVKENNKNKLIYVCSECQKKPDWIEKAEVKSA